MAEKLRAVVGEKSSFKTYERSWRRMSFFTETGEVSKAVLDAWQRRSWVENTSTKALPNLERVREWELTEAGAEALMLEEPLETEAPPQSADLSPHSPELSEHPAPHDMPQ